MHKLIMADLELLQESIKAKAAFIVKLEESLFEVRAITSMIIDEILSEQVH